jgi:hypothetical protein
LELDYRIVRQGDSPQKGENYPAVTGPFQRDRPLKTQEAATLPKTRGCRILRPPDRPKFGGGDQTDAPFIAPGARTAAGADTQ